ncbi:galactokinase [Algoriphagus sediminis]|uniref:Galactokinase n=1 Tax=Algoriphagus sediminis TaxID=3057113 RepID=A0ABT7Y8U9_9BACT|nr:galactokinase [Algoriphagus sediminis]MDN3202936.1 galactokinase [Algoriphagus sediminis]
MQALLKAEFEKLFDEEPKLFFAPGRINLIGEHTDYQEGLVLPAAIPHGIYVAISLNGKNHARLHSIDFQEDFAFDLDGFSPKKGHWATYIMGMCSQLRQAGIDLKGFDMAIGGNIPVGAGLSSSAALSVAAGLAISSLNGILPEKKSLARYAQKSEQLYAGLNCGIMDPYASIFGDVNSALLLDCRNIEHEVIPVALENYQIILVNSQVKHTLAESAYNERRAACEESVEILKTAFLEIKTLRDASPDMLHELESLLKPELYSKAKHVIKENTRVIQAAHALRKGNLESFGRLLNLSHQSLSEDFQVSCEELDFLALKAQRMPFVLGSRMMGGGFGGCTLNLLKSSETMKFEQEIRAAYKERFGIVPEFIPTALSGGAKALS